MKKRKKFVLYDGRAVAGEPDEASVMDTADTEVEARQAGSTTWAQYDAIWYEYEQSGDKFINGTPRYDLPPRR